MSIEMSYVVITPYSIVKSRTGGVISRLISRLDLELVAGQVLALNRDLAKEYAMSVRSRVVWTEIRRYQTDLISDYIDINVDPSEGRRHRVMLLLFKGKSACRKINDLAAKIDEFLASKNKKRYRENNP